MSKRAHVKGRGPKRHELKTFYKMGEVSKETLATLNSILDTNQGNDLYTKEYDICSLFDSAKSHGVKSKDDYRQILLQGLEAEDTAPVDENEFRYSHWLADDYPLKPLLTDLGRHFDATARFRLSETQPHKEIAWHIDTNTSVACRAQICLHDNDSVFEFKDRDGVHQLFMKPGEMWFINTGWPHRVVTGDVARRTAVWSFEFEWLARPQDIYK